MERTVHGEKGAGGPAAAAEEVSDEALARRVQAGDTRATRILIERYASLLRPQVRRRLPRRLRPKLGESDVLQDAFLGAIQRIDSFVDRGPGSFRAWITQIATHKTQDHIRRFVGTAKRDAGREEPGGTERGTTACPKPTPSAVTASRERREALRRALEALSPNYRMVLELVHFRGLALAEAARVMRRTPDAVRMLHGRAVGKLGERLREG